ncbi:MAG: hypothetical protein M4579_006570 [Chaenotheca gracillima]|nr:MAG: hypothetical protein M4579_006570 [Chaenotheca gracillima]
MELEKARSTSWTRFVHDGDFEDFGGDFGFPKTPAFVNDLQFLAEIDGSKPGSISTAEQESHNVKIESPLVDSATNRDLVQPDPPLGTFQSPEETKQILAEIDSCIPFDDICAITETLYDDHELNSGQVNSYSIDCYGSEQRLPSWPDFNDFLKSAEDPSVDREFGGCLQYQRNDSNRADNYSQLPSRPAPVINMVPYDDPHYGPQTTLPYYNLDNSRQYISQDNPKTLEEYPASLLDDQPDQWQLPYYVNPPPYQSEIIGWTPDHYSHSLSKGGSEIQFSDSESTSKGIPSIAGDDDDGDKNADNVFKPRRFHKLAPRRPEPNPEKPWVRVNATTLGKNLMSAKMMAYSAKKEYRQFYEIAESPNRRLAYDWDEFTYTKYGELEEGRKYTVQQMEKYLFNHPLHTVKGVTNTKNHRLVLWVQMKPATMDFRYLNQYSSKCRFKDCPAPHSTIDKGDYQVCFDEQSWKGESNDPLVNAGWVHLYCLEELMDLPAIFGNLCVRADDRTLPLETDGINRMSVVASKSVYSLAKKYIKRCVRDLDIVHGPKKGLPYNQWFSHDMMVAKRNDQPPARLARQTGPTQWPQHLGNIRGLKLAKVQERNTKRAKRSNRRDHYSDSEGESSAGHRVTTPLKRGPGRPRKHPLPSPSLVYAKRERRSKLTRESRGSNRPKRVRDMSVEEASDDEPSSPAAPAKRLRMKHRSTTKGSETKSQLKMRQEEEKAATSSLSRPMERRLRSGKKRKAASESESESESETYDETEDEQTGSDYEPSPPRSRMRRMAKRQKVVGDDEEMHEDNERSRPSGSTRLRSFARRASARV